MGRIFGTDGIRGVAGVDMTPELALDLGRAAATVVKERGNTHPHFLIGRDTRISGGMLESAIAAGLCSVGADVTLLGVITTPGVAYLAGNIRQTEPLSSPPATIPMSTTASSSLMPRAINSPTAMRRRSRN